MDLKNDFDIEKYDTKYLRIYARMVGVKAPCSKTKETIIKEIRQVENGELEPVFTKRGRPLLMRFSDRLNGLSVNEEYLKVRRKKEIIEKIKELNRQYILQVIELIESL